ncbi:ImuA family protein [Mesorhizobium sp. ZC-5]|uniref:ImuA family protein n=1 Tax=Mesorhizobium sp. ZC-5 TaxID=2986066 RepID=UPI0021E6E36F|nr:hypothetical protein [Mesorhizobium sp. ZC-5]MCV3239181.1 hypothetical protein [Mesorhizobium sp. ZC-5]
MGGGLPAAGLIEIHGGELRDGGAVAGFAWAMAGLVLRGNEAQGKSLRGPILWIGTSQAFAEMGFPHAPGLSGFSGFSPDELLVAQASKLLDALWIAEEAAKLRELSAVFLELDGNPNRLDLTATRRLHRRGLLAGRPIFLLRQAAHAEPTAAPVRLIVSAAPASPRNTLAGPLAGTIGQPAFTVTIGKSRTALPGEFILEWNPHERAFQERRPENSRPVVSAPFLGSDLAPTAGEIVAFKPVRPAIPADHQPSGKQHPAHRRTRRAG